MDIIDFRTQVTVNTYIPLFVSLCAAMDLPWHIQRRFISSGSQFLQICGVRQHSTLYHEASHSTANIHIRLRPKFLFPIAGTELFNFGTERSIRVPDSYDPTDYTGSFVDRSTIFSCGRPRR